METLTYTGKVPPIVAERLPELFALQDRVKHFFDHPATYKVEDIDELLSNFGEMLVLTKEFQDAGAPDELISLLISYMELPPHSVEVGYDHG